MKQSTDDLESRLRELFERQAAGISTSASTWGAPMVSVDELEPRRRSRSAVAAVVSVAAAVLVVVGVVAVLPDDDNVIVGGAGSGVPVRFDTPQVNFTAGALVIDADGHRFTPPASGVDVSSDPGTVNEYTTLELVWHENGVEMRMNIYFASDGKDWWANEIRTYNGHTPGDWLYYTGTFFRAPLGQAFTGDVDLHTTQSGTGRLQIAGLRLRAFLPPAACENATSKYALDIAYANVDLPKDADGFGIGVPRLLDTTTCTPVADPAAYVLDAQIVDPGVAGLDNYELKPPIAAQRRVNLGDGLDVAPKAAGTTTLRLTVHRRADDAVVATAALPVKVG